LLFYQNSISVGNFFWGSSSTINTSVNVEKPKYVTPSKVTNELNPTFDKNNNKTSVIKTPGIKTPGINTPGINTPGIRTPGIKTPDAKDGSLTPNPLTYSSKSGLISPKAETNPESRSEKSVFINEQSNIQELIGNNDHNLLIVSISFNYVRILLQITN